MTGAARAWTRGLDARPLDSMQGRGFLPNEAARTVPRHYIGQRRRVEVPPKFQFLYMDAPYKAAFGGRGSAKSHSFAEALTLRAFNRKIRWLCCREIQKSIASSVKQLLDDKIAKLRLTDKDGNPFFRSLETEIRGANGSLINFAGLRTNPDAVKSMEGLDGAWIEEASRVSARSLEILEPTLRKEGAELWATWNPEDPKDPIDAMFRGPNGPPPGAVVVEVGYEDNPWFPDILRQKMEHDRRRDPDKYAHVWCGQYRRHSQARVFHNWRIAEPDEIPDDPPPGTRLHFGADWGYSVDPSVLIRSWMPDEGTLYIDEEAYGIGIEIEDLPALFAGSDAQDPPRWSNPHRHRGVRGALRGPIRADSARPDTISYMRNRGFSITAAAKGAGSVEDGIEFLKSVDIVVHPRCTNTIDELSFYSWKVDPHTEEVLSVLDDKNNHLIDSLRYSHEGTRHGRAGRAQLRGLVY